MIRLIIRVEIAKVALAAALEKCVELKAEGDALRAELEVARAQLAHKDDTIESYSEFYERAASLAGLPQDCNPCAEADEIILNKIAEHDEIATLRAQIAELVKDRDEWKSEYEMFAKAWGRELGGAIPKTHLIDSLVLTTRKMRARLAELETYIAKLGIVTWGNATAPQGDNEPPQVTK